MKPFTIHPSQKKHLFSLFGLILLILTSLGLILYFNKYQKYLWPVVLVIIGIYILNLIYTYFYTERYEITVKESGVEFAFGVLNRTTETVEMHRIVDYKMYQDFDDLLLGLGSISVYSNDKTTPLIVFKGLETHDAAKMLDALQQYASDSLVKHLNKIDDDKLTLNNKRAIINTYNGKKSNEP